MINNELNSDTVIQEYDFKNQNNNLETNVNKLTPIIGKTVEKKEQLQQWAKNKGATKLFLDLADLYWTLSQECGGVDPTVAYIQAAMETNFGKFDGSLKEELKNPSGIKIYNESDEEIVQEAYAKFNTWIDGVCAHLDHLALYAGGSEYPRENTTDPRHFSYLLGVCKYVEELSRKWSVSENYSKEISSYMSEISETIVTEEYYSSITPNLNIIESATAQQAKDNIDGVKKLLDEIKIQNNNICKVVEALKGYIDELAEENKKLIRENLQLIYDIEKYKKVTNQINKQVTSLKN